MFVKVFRKLKAALSNILCGAWGNNLVGENSGVKDRHNKIETILTKVQHNSEDDNLIDLLNHDGFIADDNDAYH